MDTGPELSPEADLRLTLLGGFELHHSGDAVTMALHRKARALLAYLVMEGARSFPREHLASLFWPDLAIDSARNNLRQTLHQLRRTLGAHAPAVLETTRDTVHVHKTAALWVDAQAMNDAQQPCTRCPQTPARPPCQHELARMREGLALHQGEFLAGLELPDNVDFERWRDELRERLTTCALSLAETLRTESTEARDWQTALGYARKAIALRPWNENLHRDYMQLLARAGQQAEAIAWYQHLRNRLLEEFGLEPLPETRAVLNTLREQGTDSLGLSLPDDHTLRPGRRLASVLCCYLEAKGTLREETLEALALARLGAAECLRRHGGHVTSGHGSCLLAYFGYPLASQDAGEQAALAILSLQETLASRFDFHAGLCTAPIIAGTDPGVPDLDGTASRSAMQLCRRSVSGDILIDAASHDLLHTRFRLHAAPAQSGRKPLAPSWRLEGVAAHGPGDAFRRHCTPLLGRDAEMAALRTQWQAACAGKGRAVLIRGGTGLGKTHLMHAACAIAYPQNALIRRLQCRADQRHTPLYPFVALFESLCGFADGDDAATRRARMVAYVDARLDARYPSLRDEMLAMLEALLTDVQGTDDTVPARLHPQQVSATIPAVIRELAMQQPLLFIIEEVQWADSFTLEVLQAVIRNMGDLPVLFLMSAEACWAPSWPETVQTLDLQPLPPEAIRDLVRRIAPALDPAVIAAIVERADGIPLYAHELAVAAARDPAHAPGLPPTLNYLLLARIDSVPEVLRTLQVAATIGEDISPALLARVCALDEATLASHLARLAQAQLLVRHPHDADIWQFQHRLLQEVVYDSQMVSDREEAHLQIAQTLCRDYPVRARQHPVRVAQHYEAAGSLLSAVGWWRMAGLQAQHLCAFAQAGAHFEKALALVAELQSNPARQALELSILLPLGQVLLAWHGYGSAQAIDIHERAWALCDADTPPARRFHAALGLWFVSSSRPGSNFIQSGKLAEALLSLAKQSGQAGLLAQAYSALANIALWRNRLDDAIAHAGAGLSQQPVDDEGDVDASPHTIHPHVCALAHESWALARLGRMQQADRAHRRCLALVRNLNSPHNQCMALAFGAMLGVLQARPQRVGALNTELGRLARRHDMALWTGCYTLLTGWRAAQRGKHQGLQIIRHALPQLEHSMPSILSLGYFLLAQACAFLGQTEALQQAIADGLAAADAVGEGFYRAQLAEMAAGTAGLSAG